MGVPWRRGWLHPRVPVTKYFEKLISMHFLTCDVRREIKTKANFEEVLCLKDFLTIMKRTESGAIARPKMLPGLADFSIFQLIVYFFFRCVL
jgi:hypothetical protein